MVPFNIFISDTGSGIEYTFGKFAKDTNILKGRDVIQRDLEA